MENEKEKVDDTKAFLVWSLIDPNYTEIVKSFDTREECDKWVFSQGRRMMFKFYVGRNLNN